MYHEAFESDTNEQKWDSGCWIRYKMFERILKNQPTIGGWISVKDRLPTDVGIYIICDHYGNVMSRHFCKSHGKVCRILALQWKRKIWQPIVLDAAARATEGGERCLSGKRQADPSLPA